MFFVNLNDEIKRNILFIAEEDWRELFTYKIVNGI